MFKLSFSEYLDNARKYNSRCCESEVLTRYKKGLLDKWRSPNSVDVKMVRNEKEISIYMAKYMVKDAVAGGKEDLSLEDELLLERGKEFGRAWFCSRSLSRLDTKFKFSFSEVRDILDLICESEGSKLFVGDFFKVWFFDYSKLSFRLRGYLRGWLLYNASLSDYCLPGVDL